MYDTYFSMIYGIIDATKYVSRFVGFFLIADLQFLYKHNMYMYVLRMFHRDVSMKVNNRNYHGFHDNCDVSHEVHNCRDVPHKFHDNRDTFHAFHTSDAFHDGG